MSDATPYLSGLILTDRKVVVVGGGHVAQRRVPTLIASGARVSVVSPEVTPALEGMGGEVTLVLREFVESDLDGAWYVVAATDDKEANERISVAAEERRIFCVRSDDGTRGTAWTPASGKHGTVTVGVLGNREPMKSASLRDDILTALREGLLTAVDAHDRTPGVVLVGGGPGDPELVTIAARHALASADVVVADRLAPRELLDELPPGVELIDVAKLPRGRFAHAGVHQRGDRGARPRGQAGRAVQGRRQLRLRSRLRGGHRLRRCRRAGDAWSRDSRPRSPCRPGPASPSPTVASRTSSPSSRATCLPGTPTRWSSGRRSPGCAARW